MKIITDFKPPPSEDGNEFYPNGIFVFNISKLVQYISKNLDIFQAELVKVNSIPSYSTTYLNEDAVMTAKVTTPIIMAEISPGQFNVIDGHHRLEKSRRENKENVLAYKIPPEHHSRFLTSTESYQAYVEYWNTKMKDRELNNAI